MVFEPTLAVRAANAETALRSILRGEHDEWTASALKEGVRACQQLLAGVQEPRSVSYFSDPDTMEGVLFFESKYRGRSGEVLQELEKKLRQAAESPGATVLPEQDLNSCLNILRELSLRLCEQDQLIERTLA